MARVLLTLIVVLFHSFKNVSSGKVSAWLQWAAQEFQVSLRMLHISYIKNIFSYMYHPTNILVSFLLLLDSLHSFFQLLSDSVNGFIQNFRVSGPDLCNYSRQHFLSRFSCFADKKIFKSELNISVNSFM